MPKKQELTWSKLRVGLTVIVSLTILALFIFLVTGEGFFQRKYTLKTYMDNAGGLKDGDPVRLAGIDAGNVENIRISGSHDPRLAVEVDMKIQKKYQDEIRTDSEAIMAAEGLLGQRYLNISRGSPNQPVIPDGGAVKLKETADIGDIMASSADVMTNLNRVTTRVDHILAQVEAGKGSLGKVIYDESLFDKANKGIEDLQRLVAFAAEGNGSLGKFLISDELYNSAKGTLTKADQVVDYVRSGQGSAGKFIYDPGMYNDAQKAINRIDTILAGVDQGQGSLGKFIKDETFYNRATSAVDSFGKVGAELESGQGSAGKLLKDPALYNNLNTFSLELRDLIADFRKDPKKFLTIHFRVF